LEHNILWFGFKASCEILSRNASLEKKYEYPSYVGLECGGVEIELTPKPEEERKTSPLSPSVEFLVEMRIKCIRN
jgi:hypothetical protein